MLTALWFFLLVIGLLALPLLWRFTLAVYTSIFQIYTLPLFNIYPSLALLSHLSLLPQVIQHWRILLTPPLLTVVSLMVWQAFSITWSPNKHLGVATLVYEMPFIIIFTMTFYLINAKSLHFSKLIRVYAYLSLAPIITLTILRFHFDLDADFLQSSMASTVINPNTLAHTPYATQHVTIFNFFRSLLTTRPMTGYWFLDKPHSFFMNPNNCAAYLGICALLLWGSASYTQQSILKKIAMTHWLSLFLISSIAANILAFALPLLIFLLHGSTHKNFKVIKLACLFILATLMVTLISMLYFEPDTLAFINHKLEARLVLWQAALALYRGHFWSGLGFGGWEIAYANYRITVPYNPMLQPYYPPHNTLIQLWTQSGILAACLGSLFMYFCLRTSWQAYRLAEKQEKLFCLCVLAAFSWVFLQGMGENWGLTGEMHMQPILAVCFAMMVALYQRRNKIN